MIEALTNGHTIVIMGAWNASIFSPEWMINNVFDSDEVKFQIGIRPGSPDRIIGDNIVIVPKYSSLLFRPTEISDELLVTTQNKAYAILGLLAHTPVSALGINFLYRIAHPAGALVEKFPTIFQEELATLKYAITNRKYVWQFQYEDRILNLSINIGDDGILIDFNFHKAVKNATEGQEALRDKILTYKQESIKLLEEFFGVSGGDIQNEGANT